MIIIYSEKNEYHECYSTFTLFFLFNTEETIIIIILCFILKSGISGLCS